MIERKSNIGGYSLNTILVKKKKGRNKSFIFIIFGCLLFFGIIIYGLYWAFFDMNRLPTGEYLTEETSKDGNYTLKAYLANGGATTSYSIRGELVFNNPDNKTKTIYWNDREETANIECVDNDTVVINGHSIDVSKDKFDFRNQ